MASKQKRMTAQDYREAEEMNRCMDRVAWVMIAVSAAILAAIFLH